mgnify:CR=1 FL=1
MRYSILFIFSVILLFGCGAEAEKKSSETVVSTEKSKILPTPNKYTISPFTNSPEYGDAALVLEGYKAGKFDFKVGGESYKLGVQTPDASQKMCANSAKGQHIHLIVDNQPYAAKYTSEFEYDVPDGQHYLLAFLSRSYHESIKTKAAHIAKQVFIKDKSIFKEADSKEPMLFYSRPKGTYVGKADTKKIMLDFYLANLELGQDYKVVADINGEKHTFTKWQPYFIEGLPMGENTITLTLVDGSGKKVDTPLNPVTRTFTLKADPTE